MPLVEDTLVRCLHNQLRQASSLPPIQVEKAIEWAQNKAGFTFADQQAEAVRQALKSKISILTGGPGTGKTTILRALVAILKAKKTKILLAAPTGRAARRMAESCSHFAQTVHRLLKFDPSKGGFTQNEQNPLVCDFLIMDETSMLDLRLAASLIRSLPPKAHLLLVGDADQLPSVGSGNVLKDLIQSELFRVTRLAVTFRQSENSGIVRTGDSILAGKGSPPPIDSLTEINPHHDVHFVRAITPEDCVSTVTRLSKDIIPKKFFIDPKTDLQILAPLHRGIGGIGNLNDKLRGCA